MILSVFFDFTLPLKNPVLIFSVILFIILFAPILLNKIRIPHLIGLILAGAIIGPHGLYLLQRDSSVVLFGTVGLLYIMFMAGLEIDMADFMKNSWKGIIFGLYTFIIPMLAGTLAGIYILQFSVITSVLMASMFASHTLITYPIVSKLGIVNNRAVIIAVGGTLVTCILALMVLAVIVRMSHGELSGAFWLQLGISVLLFGAVVMAGFPMLARWFLKRYSDSISQYIFVLAMVFLGSFLAELAGIEAIIGAFLAGLSLNRLIPVTSPLMNRVHFVGNALFIPFFLIGVGMLLDYTIFFTDLNALFVGMVMTLVATGSKYISAILAQKTFKMTPQEGKLIFGLSNAQAAATLAAVLVGYNIIIGETLMGEPVRLLGDSILSGTILMILVTCTIASFVTQQSAEKIALAEYPVETPDDPKHTERILIPINNLENAEELINLSIATKTKSPGSDIFVLNILNNAFEDALTESNARKILDKATIIASSSDTHIHQLLRYDLNTVNGITNVVREQKITDIILGLHQKKEISDTFLGHLTSGVLSRCNVTTLIYKAVQPLSTARRIVVVVPSNAERETGFAHWLVRLWNISRNSGSRLVFYADEQTLQLIRKVQVETPVEAEFNYFSNWDDFLVLAREIKRDDILAIILSRENYLSYNRVMAKIPYFLKNYFNKNSFILIFPTQTNLADEPYNEFYPYGAGSLERFDKLGETVTHLLRKRRG